MKQGWCFLVVLAISSLASATAFGADSSPLASGKNLFEEKCGTCHELERALVVQSDRSGWEGRIKRMVDYGASIDETESVRILDYLTR